MKKLVTTLFLLLGLALTAEGSFAQQAVMLGTPTVKELPAKLQKLGDKHAPSAVMVAPDVKEVTYFDPETPEESLVPWTLPRLISYSDGGMDTLVLFMMRMTNPYGTDFVYLDSVSAMLQANRVIQDANNNLQFFVWYAQEPNATDGVIRPAKAAGSTKSLKATTLTEGESQEVGINFRTNNLPTATRRKLDFTTTWTDGNNEKHPVHPTDFFVGVAVTYFTDLEFDPENDNNQQNDIAVVGDAIEDQEEYDPEIHRGFAWGQTTWLPWRLQDADGNRFFSNFAIKAFVSDQPKMVAGVDQEIATTFSLRQNYPNPFAGATEINYSVKETTPVSIKVYNTMGVEIASLVNETMPRGEYSVSFDASKLASGNYIYTMTAGGETITKAMTVAK